MCEREKRISLGSPSFPSIERDFSRGHKGQEGIGPSRGEGQESRNWEVDNQISRYSDLLAASLNSGGWISLVAASSNIELFRTL